MGGGGARERERAFYVVVSTSRRHWSSVCVQCLAGLHRRNAVLVVYVAIRVISRSVLYIYTHTYSQKCLLVPI